MYIVGDNNILSIACSSEKLGTLYIYMARYDSRDGNFDKRKFRLNNQRDVLCQISMYMRVPRRRASRDGHWQRIKEGWKSADNAKGLCTFLRESEKNCKSSHNYFNILPKVALKMKKKRNYWNINRFQTKFNTL